MDTLDTYRQGIEKVLRTYAQISYAHGEIQTEVVLDRQADHYLVLAVGWDGARRIHGSIIHLDIINGKVWIQRDSTEHGIAEELVEAGIPRDQIVLGFRPADLRQYTAYAVA
jgi:XisI protein